MSGCTIITYKGKEIIYADHHELNGEEFLNNAKLTTQMAKDYKRSEALLLANFTDTVVGGEAMAYLNSPEVLEVNKKYKKMAMFGVAGIKKIMVNAYNILMGDKVRVFDTEKEALEFLVK